VSNSIKSAVKADVAYGDEDADKVYSMSGLSEGWMLAGGR